MYFTTPAAFAVALILIGASPNTPLPPLSTNVPSDAALAGEMLIDKVPSTATAIISFLDLIT
jgi:hypothetical protein